MSLRLIERYQSIQLKSGIHAYRIYNLDIISRLNILSESQSTSSEDNQENDEKRCTYRSLTFIEPEIHFYMNSQSQQNKTQDSKKYPFCLKKQNSYYSHRNGKTVSISNSEFDQSNSDQHTPKYVTKKISKDKKYQLKINHPHQYINQTIPESSASQATSTQLMMHTQEGQKSPQLQSNSNKNQSSKIISKQEEYYLHQQVPTMLNDYRHTNIDNQMKLNIDTKIEQEDNSMDNCLNNEQMECDPRKFVSLNIQDGRNLNQTINDFFYQNKNFNYTKDNNYRNINNLNRNYDQHIQFKQAWSIKQEPQLMNNKNFMISEKSNSLAGEKYQLMCSKIPNQSIFEKENKILNERKVSFANSSNSATTNNNMKENQIIENFHNSEIFKTLSVEYKMIPKNNTLKNIKKAFIRYLLKTSRKQLIKKCEQFNLDVGHILTVLCQEIKYDHRHNKNIRFLLKCDDISPLFKDFLENSDDYWFSNSSLLNEVPCRQMVALLLKLTTNSQLVDVIQEYEK